MSAIGMSRALEFKVDFSGANESVCASGCSARAGQRVRVRCLRVVQVETSGAVGVDRDINVDGEINVEIDVGSNTRRQRQRLRRPHRSRLSSRLAAVGPCALVL